MKIFVLGGTGSIGSAVVQTLLERNHQVFALGRTSAARKSLEQAGATPVKGDLENPADWIDVCNNVDGIVHAAAVWGDQMGSIDSLVVEAILSQLQSDDTTKTFVYTGGCWLYGETGDSVATENSPFKPLASFAWSIPTIQSVLTATHVKGIVIHPAMVYDRNGGVFDHIFADAKNLGYVRVVHGENVRWPLIHRMDLAQLYALLLEQGERGDVYNAVTNHGVTIGSITRAIASRLGIEKDPVIVETQAAIGEIASYAEGYALDQQMSGEKARSKLGWQPRYEDLFAEIS